MLRLPDEMLLQICGHLGRQDRLRLGACSQRLHHVSTSRKVGLEDLPLNVLAQIMGQLPVQSMLAAMRASYKLRASVLNKAQVCWKRTVFLEPYLTYGEELQQLIGKKTGVYPCMARFQFGDHEAAVARFQNYRLHPLDSVE